MSVIERERDQARRALACDGWLFDLAEEGRPPGEPSAEGLGRLAASLAAAAASCEELGIAYIPALVPRKRDAVSGRSREPSAPASALRARLRDLDDVELLDLLDVLHDASRHGSPYHRSDAGWNDRGAFFVARALLKEAHKRAPALRPPSLADLHLRAAGDYRGPLAELPRVREEAGGLVPDEGEPQAGEPAVFIDASRRRSLRMPVESRLAEAAPMHVQVYATPECDEGAHLGIVGESAALSLLPWLAERASRTVLFHGPQLPLPALALERPPAVLHLLREAELFGG
jgi:hypothetical protein